MSREVWSAFHPACLTDALRPPTPLMLSGWRREALRTNLWLVPILEVAAAIALYAMTHEIDRAADAHSLTLASWLVFGTPGSSRQILTTLAAAVITVVGVVFSIMIVTLTLASTQFGPRMLRNFIRDRGTQFTLGALLSRMSGGGGTVAAPESGYLQFVRHKKLVGLAIQKGAVIRLLHAPATSWCAATTWPPSGRRRPPRR